MTRQKRVLVLGAGFVGSAVTRALLDRACEVLVVTRSQPAKRTIERMDGAEIHIGDATDMGTLAPALAETDEVVYALGASSPVESDMAPADDISLVVPPLIRLLELLRLRPAIRITFLSSGGTIYGNQNELPIPESAHPQPISSYGIIKLTCEHYIQMYADYYRVNARILRVANAYGPDQPLSRGQGVVARLIHSALTDEVIPIFGLTDAVRDYVYIADVADAVAQLVTRPDGPRLVNVGTGQGHSLAQLLDITRRTTGSRIPIRSLDARSFDVAANVLDISRLRNATDVEPRDLITGLEETWNWATKLDPTNLPTFTPPKSPER